MGYVSRHISYGDFMWLFKLFGDDVRAGFKKPLPYNEYRTLKKALDMMGDKDVDMIVDYNTKTHEVVVFTDKDIFHFDVDGDSFGAFLFDELHFLDELYDKEAWENPYYPRVELEKENCKLVERIEKNINTDLRGSVKKEKEKSNMKFNFDFGPVVGNDVRMSLYGLAVKNKSGAYVSYDAKSGSIMDVEVLNFEGAKFLYKMPVAIKDIAIGDIIVHHRVPMFVVAIAVNGGFVTAVDPVAGERKEIMLTKSPFGFDFVTKVVNLLGNMTGTASAENPFGNLGMMMAMSNENEDTNDVLPFLMMNNATPDIDNNVLMFMALSNCTVGCKDMLPWLLMKNAIKPVTHECKCNINCTGTAVEA